MSGSARRGRYADAAVAATIALGQALLVLPLFGGRYTQWRGSIEAAFITDARFILERFPDLSWDPLWYMGFPFELFYTPLLQVAAALLGLALGDVASAYRIVAASGFALGPAGLYLFARSLALSRAAAALGATVFAAAPLASYALPGLTADGSAVTGSAVPLPWRLVVLVEYGEGPHVLGLSLALFAAAAVVGYLRQPGAVRFAAAAALLVAVALTNLIAVLGAAVLAAMAVLAVGADPGRVRRGAVLGATVALLSLVWYSPGFVVAVAGFSTPGGAGGGAGYLWMPAVVAAAAAAGRVIGRRDSALGIVVASGITFTTILVAWYAERVAIAPQPIRYALELDAVTAVAVALALERLVAPRARTLAAIGAAAAVLALSAPGWSAVAPRIAADPAWESWSERRVALWLAERLGPGERAYLSGSHAFWAGVFADVPQIRGGVDFAGLDPWWAHATYQINTGSDAAVSARWLRALGVRYAVVTGPDSRDAYRDFARPEMFEGILPLAATIDGARIYEVPAPHAAPALIWRAADPTPPRDALDGATLDRYLATFDARSGSVALRQVGLGGWEGEIATEAAATLLVPVAYDAGWRVHLDERPAATRADTVGLLAVDVPAGTTRVRIDHRVHGDLLAGNAIVFAFLAFVAGRRALRSGAGRRLLPPLLIAATVTAYALALGVVGGYPKGTDAPMHLARLRFMAEWFPNGDWLYAWAAGMPSFDSYPALPYFAGIPLVRTIGAEATLELFALLSFVALGLGLYGHLVERGRSVPVALIAALMAVTSMALWAWIANGGVYARPMAIGLGALAWWTHARALRTDGRAWWAATAALLAAAVAAHQYMGVVPALYVAAVHLSSRGAAGVAGLARLAAASVMLAAPAIVPALAAGGRGFLGRERSDLIVSPPEVLVSPVHVGLAAFGVPLVLIVLEIGRRPLRALAAAAALGGVTLYLFAPTLGIPSRLYYVAGIDPFTMTYGVALLGTLAYAALARDGPRARTGLAVAAALVAANAALAVPAYAAQRTYPQVVDTTAPGAHERIARETLVVAGDDVAHRIVPFTALEAVWFTDAYRKPMLRDYFDQGQVDRDWIAWAYDALYTPPLAAGRVRAVQHWYAVDSVTALPGQPAERELAAMPGVALVPSTAGRMFHQYALDGAPSIAVTSTAPLLVVVADRLGYDRVARLLFDEGTTPAMRIPLWWSGTLADLPADLRERAAAVLVVGDRIGSAEDAARTAREVARRGGRVVWDLAGVADGGLTPPWPRATILARAIQTFDVRDRDGRIGPAGFSPARYGDAAWGAQVLVGPAQDEVELGLGADALVVTSREGDGALTVVGGNLFYHALSYANAAERGYLMSLLGPGTADAAVDAADWFVDPDHRTIPTSGATVLLKESIHPAWTARWRGADGTERDLQIRYAGPALMAVIPPGPGTVAFSYGTGPAQLVAWAAASLAGVILTLWTLRRPRSLWIR